MVRIGFKTLSWMVLGAALFVSVPAGAITTYPLRIDSHLSLGYAPDCVTCHATAVGGIGTVTQPFGMAMMARGLVAYDDQSLYDALDQMEVDAVDSDGDGTTDIQELRNHTNPNSANDTVVTAPEFGCFGRITGRAPAPGGLLIAGVLLAGWLIRRRSRGRVCESS